LVLKAKIKGGSRLDPEVKWVALIGTSKATTPIEIDDQESLKKVIFLAPPWDEFMAACASTMDFEAIAPSANDVEVKVRGWCVSLPCWQKRR
jgi:hypothetical protein